MSRREQRSAAADIRRKQAMALRRSGKTYNEIGAALDTHPAYARDLVRIGVMYWFKAAGLPMPKDKSFDELLAMIPDTEP